MDSFKLINDRGGLEYARSIEKYYNQTDFQPKWKILEEMVR